MKILRSDQIRDADQYTIQNEPISSLDLMERASEAFVTRFIELVSEELPIFVFCGTGNNGGDALAIARLLKKEGYQLTTFVIGDPENGSEDFEVNLRRTENHQLIADKQDFPEIESGIIIDGIFGSGLSRPAEGLYGDLINYLNQQNAVRVAIDIASGLFADQPLPEGSIAFQPDYTISFQVAKLAFVLPQCSRFVGEWHIVDIGLDSDFIEQQNSPYLLSEALEMSALIPNRGVFSHKNQVGRLQIVAGSRGKMGAAVLCARAAFRSGIGLVNVHVPGSGLEILQTSVPEAMVIEDVGLDCIKEMKPTDDTVALGPGLGTNEETAAALSTFLQSCNKPVVIDADGINLLAARPDALGKLPAGTILTPHPGEFKRLVGDWEDDFEKLEKLRSFCKEHQLNIVLKGAYSAVCNADGTIFFNPTGNSGMATAGSGDVLTGVVGALLAQGLEPFDALRLGVFLHGLAGDVAVAKVGFGWINATDISHCIPEAAATLPK